LSESVYIGLFSGQCWLRRGLKGEPKIISSSMDQRGSSSLDQLQQLLESHASSLKKGARIHIVISDAFASMVTMPWQDQLSRASEVENYARICFDKQRINIDSDSLLHAEFRHFGGIGIAYVVSREWMQALLDLVQSKGFRLLTVQPLSAVAYFNQASYKGGGLRLLLLQENHRISAMVWNKLGLVAYDIEAFAHSSEDAQVRLLRRTVAMYNKISHVDFWPVNETHKLVDIKPFVDDANEMKVATLHRMAWM